MNFRATLLFIPSLIFADRGDLITYQKKAQVSQKEHKALCSSFSVPCKNMQSSTVYSYSYETVDTDNNPSTASGLLVVPDTKGSLSLVVYCHGTVSDRAEAPSNLGYHMQLPLCVFTQNGHAIAIPDYLGLGESSLIFHPFCHAASLATASYDAILAAKALMQKLSLSISDKLFITGYSEGGMAALSLHAYVEKHPIQNLNLKASAPMSGPYALSDSLPFALKSSSSRMNTYMSYVVSSYNKVYPNLFPDFSQVFNVSVQYLIPLLFDGCHSFWQISPMLSKVSPLFESQFIEKNLLQSSDFSKTLSENDTYRFTPKSPVHFIALEKDTEVGYLNSVKAYEYMKERKAPVSLLNASSDLDHMQGSPLCHIRALEYFQSF